MTGRIAPTVRLTSWHGRLTRLFRVHATIAGTAALLSLALVVSSLAPGATLAAEVRLKAVFIVGPTGTMTPMLRAQADRAAELASAAGAEVVRVYSPNATWPVVKQAISGASIVVYLGHGYGFPSPYRQSLYPPSHNGFGLNPVADGGDDAHQYFGEAYVEDLDLAPNAVVLLHHLCYASGNSETGMPEPSVDVAIQRADNFAAGFLRAGAAAVIAEGHLGPAYYVNALLNSSSTLERIWQLSPEAHGNEFAVASVRSPEFTARLDPDRPGAGYFRSIVSRGGLPASAVRDSGQGYSGETAVPVPLEPSLAPLGLVFGTTALDSPPIAGTTTRAILPLETGRRRVPEGIQLGFRWDPILVDSPFAGPVSDETIVDPAAEPTPPATPSPWIAPWNDTASPGVEGVLPDLDFVPPEIDLIVSEALGTVVDLAPARYQTRRLVAHIDYPAEPGLYRLVPSLHAADGVAYDKATQDLLAPIIVRVVGPVSAAYETPASIDLVASEPVTLLMRVANVGSQAWDLVVPRLDPYRPGRQMAEPEVWPARVVATWVSTTGQPVPWPSRFELSPETSTPGSDAVIGVPISTPAIPGSYLLLIDVYSPAFGPLSALGSGPGVVRVTVLIPPKVAVTPA